MNIADQIKRGMALAFFACAYADQADEAGQPLSGQIMDQLPYDIDPAALHAADTLAMGLISDNWKTVVRTVGSIDANALLSGVYEKAESFDPDGDHVVLTPEDFGHYCAMQAMGHGVGLESFGAAVHQVIKVPYIEFGSHSLQLDYFTSDDDGGDE